MDKENPRILILGASGLLGSRVFLNLSKKYLVMGTSFSNDLNNLAIVKLDALDPNVTEKITEMHPDIIINCIAFTNVEKCEIDKDLAWNLNAEFPKKIAQLSKMLNAKLVHISTDHFDFGDTKIRNENTEVVPVNFYGESKLAGEKSVLSINNSAIVIRTNFFGSRPLNHIKNTFFETLIGNIESNRQSKGYGDIFFSPISINELIKAILNLLAVEYSGLIHICGNERISKYDFCIELVKIMQNDMKLVLEAKYESNIVKRPSDMSMSNRRYYEKTGKSILNYKNMLEEEYNLYNETRTKES